MFSNNSFILFDHDDHGDHDGHARHDSRVIMAIVLVFVLIPLSEWIVQKLETLIIYLGMLLDDWFIWKLGDEHRTKNRHNFKTFKK